MAYGGGSGAATETTSHHAGLHHHHHGHNLATRSTPTTLADGDMLAMYSHHHFQQYLDPSTSFRPPPSTASSAPRYQYPPAPPPPPPHSEYLSRDLSVDNSIAHKLSEAGGASSYLQELPLDASKMTSTGPSQMSLENSPGKQPPNGSASHKLDPSPFQCLGVDSCVC